MGTAFERTTPELVESGREVRFFANVAPKIEMLPDGNFLIYLAVERATMCELAAMMVCSPAALARIGRQFLQLSGEAHNASTLTRLVAGASH